MSRKAFIKRRFSDVSLHYCFLLFSFSSQIGITFVHVLVSLLFKFCIFMKSCRISRVMLRMLLTHYSKATLFYRVAEWFSVLQLTWKSCSGNSVTLRRFPILHSCLCDYTRFLVECSGSERLSVLHTLGKSCRNGSEMLEMLLIHYSCLCSYTISSAITISRSAFQSFRQQEAL